MWARNGQDTITEHPEEEDYESQYRQSECSSPNKIEMILNEHREEKRGNANDYHNLINKQNKIKVNNNNSENKIRPNRIIPSLIRDSPMNQNQNHSHRNNSVSSTEKRNSINSNEEEIENKNEGSVIKTKTKRSNSFQFVNVQTTKEMGDFPEFEIKYEETKEALHSQTNIDNRKVTNLNEIDLKLFESTKSWTNSEKIR